MQVSYFICRTVENVDKSTPDLDDDAGLLMYLAKLRQRERDDRIPASPAIAVGGKPDPLSTHNST